MALIGGIILDQINGPGDVATALRLLIADRIDRPQDVAFENPDPRWKGDDRTNYRFRGDETSFIFVQNCSGASYRVDVADVEFIADEDAYASLMPLVRRLGAVKALEKLRDDRESISDDEQRLIDAWNKTGLPASLAIDKMLIRHIDDPGDGDDPFVEPSYGQVEPPSMDATPSANAAGAAGLPEIVHPSSPTSSTSTTRRRPRMTVSRPKRAPPASSGKPPRRRWITTSPRRKRNAIRAVSWKATGQSSTGAPLHTGDYPRASQCVGSALLLRQLYRAVRPDRRHRPRESRRRLGRRRDPVRGRPARDRSRRVGGLSLSRSLPLRDGPK